MTFRLEKIVAALPRCRVLADVGCDHGYIGIAALERGLAEKVCFIDVSASSLAKARTNCPERYLAAAEFICRNGIGNVTADVAVIAGMGGAEIISVLQNAAMKPDKLVVQPMRNVAETREFICSAYEIVSDCKFADGKYYDLITAEKRDGGSVLTELEKHFGKTNLNCPSEDFLRYIAAEEKKYREIYRACRDVKVREKLELIRRARDYIKEKEQ